MLRRTPCRFFVPILIVVLASAVSAQTPPAATSGSINSDVLTNADILKMVEAKLGDDIIIGKIKSSPGNFDTSIDAVLKLKAAGVSDAVIRAIVEASPPAKPAVREASAKEPAPDPNDPMSPHASGIYWKPTQAAEKRMVKLEPYTYSQGKSTGMFGAAMTAGLSKMKWKIVIKGDRAALRITEAAPEFWFYFGTGGEAFSSGPSTPDDFALTRLEKKGKDRELVVGKSGLTGMSAGTRSQDTVALETKQVAPGIYQGRPNRPLEPGEYAFMRAGVTMENLASGKLFDFGVDRAK